MSFLLAVVGVLVLLLSLAGIALGALMAFDPRTRERGFYFALWWTPAAAASLGIFMGDPATFAVGALCFVVAGTVFFLEYRRPPRRRPPPRGARPQQPGSTPSGVSERRPPAKAKQPASKEFKQVLLEVAQRLFEVVRRGFAAAERWLSKRAWRVRK